jgi:hypothetical protein
LTCELDRQDGSVRQSPAIGRSRGSQINDPQPRQSITITPRNPCPARRPKAHPQSPLRYLRIRATV